MEREGVGLLAILAKLRPGSKYTAPTFRVQCPDCSSVYALTAYPSQVKRTPRCQSCSVLLRPKRPVLIDKRAQNAKYWQANKDKIAAKRKALRKCAPGPRRP